MTQQGGILVLRKTRLGVSTSRGRRGYHGVRLTDCTLAGTATAGGGGTLTRTTSGILFYDDFNRADGALGGSWVDDAGTWAISSNQATNSSAGNYDRARNTSVSAAAAVWEARLRAPSGGIYCGLRLLAPSAADDYHVFLHGGNSDKRLARAAASDTTIATLTLTMNTSYHVVKARYSGTRDFVIWFDRVLALGTLAVPFNAGAGPTAAGGVGMISYGGAALYDWVLVSASHTLTVTGLSGTQGFQLKDGSDVVIGSSGTQSAGSATLDIALLVDGLTTGYLQVYADAGTWASAVTGARYPASSTATDIAGGDSYALT